LYSHYRAHVTAADIASDQYVPVTLNDPRLEFVAAWPAGVSAWFDWHPSNTKYYYIDPRIVTSGNNRVSQKVRVKFVGVGTTMDDDPIVYDGGGLSLVQLRVSPVNEQLVVNALFTGILSVNLATNASGWIATESESLRDLNSPCFSPDGSSIAFGATRSVTATKPKKTTVYKGVYKIPFLSGPISPITETPLQGDPKIPLNWRW